MQQAGVRTAPKPCGECSLCCKILKIAEFEKAPGVWCSHVLKGKGCAIHGHVERPAICHDYHCTWTMADPLDDRWRPDRAGFLLNPGPVDSEIWIVVDSTRPDAWRREPYHSQIKRWSEPSNPTISRVLVLLRGRAIVVFPETDIDLGPPPSDPMPPIDSGYEMRDGRMQPYARYASARPA